MQPQSNNIISSLEVLNYAASCVQCGLASTLRYRYIHVASQCGSSMYVKVQDLVHGAPQCGPDHCI